ncbi:MAG: hypothetical protein ACYC4L_15235 [Chloroflexota bacterium]
MDVKRGILRAFDAAAYRATVQMHGSLQNSAQLPVSRAIAADKMVAGSTVAILEFWAHDPEASVVVAVWPA